MKTMERMLPVLMLLMLSAEVQSRDFTYTTNNGTITITGYIGSGGVVTIPGTINGLPVSTIGDYAFVDCTNLAAISIPDSVINIRETAFIGCSSLIAITVNATNSAYCSMDGVLFDKRQITLNQYPAAKTGSYTIPNSVTNIGNFAFYGCINLVKITISSNVSSVGDYAFSYCKRLTEVHFQGNAPRAGLLPFHGDNNATIYYLAGTTGWGPTFGDRPTTSGQPQIPFTYTTNKNKITLTKYTGYGGDVIIPNEINGLPVSSIGDYAFFNCKSLVGVTIDNSVASIGKYAFRGCSSLIGVTIDNSVTGIGDYAFVDCTNLTTVTIGDGVTSIGNYAFFNCKSLVSVAIPNSITNIGDWAFSNCWGISNVTIANGVTSIGHAAFYACANLTNITIPNSVTSIGDGAFAGCRSLPEITVDTANSFYCSIDGVLFNKSQTALIEYPQGKSGGYTIPHSVTNIGNGAFVFCANLTNVTIADGVTSIGSEAFSACSNLTSITIPNSVTSIGNGAFSSCTSLTSIIIPDSVTNIGVSVFYSCTRLMGVYFKGNAPSVDPSAFDGGTNATAYYLAGTTGWDTTFAGRPTALWKPQVQTSDADFGLRTNQFGFTVAWASGQTIVVEACTNLANPIWFRLQTNTLSRDLFYFSDPQWVNYPSLFFRLRSP